MLEVASREKLFRRSVKRVPNFRLRRVFICPGRYILNMHTGPGSELFQRTERVKRINVDLPEWMVASLDEKAKRLGVTRQSVIKVWIAKMIKTMS